MSETLYDVLGCGPRATAEEIKAAYRRAASAAHPDRATGDAGRMARVNEANDVLSDPDRRAEYDRTGNAARRDEYTEARNLLAAIFVAALQGGVPDILAAARSELAKRLKEARYAAETARSNLRMSDAARGRVRRRKGAAGPDLFAGVLDNLAEGARKTIDAAENAEKKFLLTRKLLDDGYESNEPEKSSAPGSTFTTTVNRGGWTTFS